MAKTYVAPSLFNDAVREAYPLRVEQRELDGPEYKKQSVVAMPREAMLEAGMDAARVEKVITTLETARDCPNAQMAFRTMQRCAREPEWTRARLKRIPRTSFGLTEDANTELAQLKITARELWAAAIVVTATKHPEAFGVVEDPEAIDARRKAIQTRLAELQTLIENKFGGDDVQFLETNQMMKNEGWCALGYKITDGEVRLGKDSARHLLDWLEQHPDRIPKEA